MLLLFVRSGFVEYFTFLLPLTKKMMWFDLKEVIIEWSFPLETKSGCSEMHFNDATNGAVIADKDPL